MISRIRLLYTHIIIRCQRAGQSVEVKGVIQAYLCFYVDIFTNLGGDKWLNLQPKHSSLIAFSPVNEDVL